MLPGALLEKETRRMKFLLPERAADQVKSLVEVGTARGQCHPWAIRLRGWTNFAGSKIRFLWLDTTQYSIKI